MSRSYKDLKMEFGTVTGCLQESETMRFFKCSEGRDETMAIMQIKLNGIFHDISCKREDLCELQEAVKSMEGRPEQQVQYQNELGIAHKELVSHEMYRRG